MNADTVSDVAGSGEPSFVHVAICTGTDMDGGSVTMVNRLCLNGPAVDLIDGDMSICEQQQKAFAGIMDVKSKQLDVEMAYGRSLTIASVVEFFMIFVLAIALHASTRK